MSSFLKVRQLTKSFNGVPAIGDLSFDIDQGSVVGLVGPNGSGKSTTVDCLTRFQQADLGSWSLEDRELSKLDRYQIARAGLTRTFQAVQAYERLSVIENLLIACQEFEPVSSVNSIFQTAVLRRAERDIEDRAHQLLEIVGLTKLADVPAGFLSYGQRKLLAIAGSMISMPKITFLDEPAAGVNPTMVLRITELLKKFNGQGVTLVVIDHNMDFIMQVCDRIIVLDLGRVIADGPPGVIQTDPRVLEVYLGESGMDVAS